MLAIGLVCPESVLQREPFLTVECGSDDGLANENGCATTDSSSATTSEGGTTIATLLEAADLCRSLSDVVAGAPGANSGGGAAADWGPLAPAPQAAEEWSVQRCVEQVLAERGTAFSDGSCLRLTALATTAHLPGEVRFEAMELARQQMDPQRLADFVGGALREEGRRRLAIKSLAELKPPEGA